MSKSQIKNEIVTYMLDNYNKSTDIKTFCDKLILSIQKDIIKNPIVYVSKYKDIKTGKEYLKAKAFLPISIDKQKELIVYVGALKDFPNGTRDESAKLIAKRKVIKRIEKLIC